MRFLAFLLVALAAVMAEVVVLDPENFDTVIDGSKNALVEFYAPWCGHCKTLAPIWDELGGNFNNHKDIVIAKVDADAHRSLGGRFGVKGFPTIKFFPKGKTDPEDYNSGRDLESFLTFLSDKTGVRVKRNTPKEATVTLTPENFDKIVMDPTKDVMVEFYAPWCGHCKTLAPKYEKVAQAFEREPNVVVAKVDADKHKDLGGKFGVSGFPTLKFFSRREKTPEDYNGGRTEEDLTNFLNDKAGTHRLPNGALNENAGKIAAFEEIITQFWAKETRQDAIKKAKELAETAEDKWSKFYHKAMEKIHELEEAGRDFVTEEAERLERLIKGGKTDGTKLDEFSIRKNILGLLKKK